MSAIYEHSIEVPVGAVDWNGHVNNLEYLRWILDAAVLHSASSGWPAERYRDIGATWVVRSHSIEYLRPAFAGEEVAVYTWVARFKEISCQRNSLCLRMNDRAVLARSETLWVFVDNVKAMPCRIPVELRRAFPVVDEDQVQSVIKSTLRV